MLLVELEEQLEVLLVELEVQLEVLLEGSWISISVCDPGYQPGTSWQCLQQFLSHPSHPLALGSR